MALVVAVVGVLVLGLVVFGGGQVFMPLFASLWRMMGHFGVHINQDEINNLFTIANATPGVIGTKFAVFSGYLAANGAWWGWLALLLTYLIFTVPSIFMIIYATKFIKQTKTNVYLKNLLIYLRPVIIGILVALAVQLFLGTAFPNLIFNGSGNYFQIQSAWSFFHGWRFYLLIAYTVVVIPESFYLYKKNMNLLLIVVIHVLLGLVLFEPWL